MCWQLGVWSRREVHGWLVLYFCPLSLRPSSPVAHGGADLFRAAQEGTGKVVRFQVQERCALPPTCLEHSGLGRCLKLTLFLGGCREGVPEVLVWFSPKAQPEAET